MSSNRSSKVLPPVVTWDYTRDENLRARYDGLENASREPMHAHSWLGGSMRCADVSSVSNPAARSRRSKNRVLPLNRS
jgi:hypothetical protein